MPGTELLGFLAACCTTIAFLPQALQVYRTRRTEDLSLGMFALFTTGVVLWLVYGLLIDSTPVWAANTFTLVLAGYILYMKITERSRAP